MPKDDLFANRTLWLDREGMETARERFWHAYRQHWMQNAPAMFSADKMPEKHDWEMAWAAAVAAFSFIMEGNLGSPVGKQPESAVDS